jgi:ATP-dependent RNA helicase RhlE
LDAFARHVPYRVRYESHILTTFSELNLSQPILNALTAEGYETPTPIQAQAIPPLMQGRDLLGIAQTGTGKTAAFALPILEKLAKDNRHPVPGTCRVLILSPTRELASQIHESFKTYGKNLKIKTTVVFGGVGIGKQIETVKRGVDIVVATPGRLVDLMDRRALTVSKTEILVLDEVDQMLDLGFIHAIRKIVGFLPKQRQNLFFSATMPKEIAGLAANLLNDPVRVEITPVATTAERVTQHVIHVDPANKVKLLVELLKDNNMTRILIFTRTKHGADKVVKSLSAAGYNAAAIHGNKSQANREKALSGFKAGKVLALVATDIAARGIDIDGVSHVINYDLPFVPESYVHRIGRTARAGADGEAIAFCIPEDRGLLRDIERTIRQQVPVKEHPLGLKVDELAPNFGWNPADGKRKSGGGRHMPKSQNASPKKPHHRGQGPRPQAANEGRFAKGDAQAPQQAPKRQWSPAANNGGQVATPTDGSQRFARAEGDRSQKQHPKPHGDRNRKFDGGKPNSGSKPGHGGSQKPKRPSGNSGGGNWMKQVSGSN